MAEILGIAAGAAGLLSLTIQVGENIIKARQLSKDYKRAAGFLVELASELESTSTLLRLLTQDLTPCRVAIEAQFVAAVQSINQRIKQKLTSLEQKLARSRQLGRVLVVLESTDVRRMQQDLESAKMSLLIAQNVYNQARLREQDLLLQQLVATVRADLAVHGFDRLGASSNSRQRVLSANTELARAGHPSYVEHIDSATHSTPFLHDSVRPETQRPRTWTLTSPRWWATTVRHVTFALSPTAWSISVDIANPVPRNAPIFEACRTNNLPLLRGLLISGQARLSDICSDILDKTPLEEAVSSMSLDVVRYILCSKHVQPTGDPLRGFCFGLSCPSRSSASRPAIFSILRLLLEHADDDDDVAEMYADLISWNMHTSVLQAIQTQRPKAIREMSLSSRITAISGFSSLTPVELCSSIIQPLLHPDAKPQHLGSAKNVFGTTMLHALAEARCQTQLDSSLSVELSQLTILVIQHHADQHPFDHQERTPLGALFDGIRSMSTAQQAVARLHQWLTDLSQAGVDLHTYGARESCLRTGADLRAETYSIIWTYGTNVEDWTMTSTKVQKLLIFEPKPMPGTYTQLDKRNVWQLPWFPLPMDTVSPGWRWRQESVVSLTKRDQSERIHEQHAGLPVPSVKLEHAQDDHSSPALCFVRQLEARNNARCRRRSSEPCHAVAEEHENAGLMDSPNHLWHAHRCCYDGRRKLTSAMDAPLSRLCASNFHAYLAWTSTGDAYVQPCVDIWCGSRGITDELKRFRYRYNSGEVLRDLPYAAYRSDWSFESLG